MDEQDRSPRLPPEVNMNALTATVVLGLTLRVLVPLLVVFCFSALLRRWLEEPEGA
jgi:hypothetical protein